METLEELKEKIDEACKVLEEKRDVLRIEVVDSQGNKAVVLSKYVHING